MTATDLHRLMVANDTLEGLEAALAKAARMEHFSGAEVLVVRTCYDALVEEPAEILPSEERRRLVDAITAAARDELAALVGPLRHKVASIESQVLWNKDAAAALVDAADRWHAELLIKPVSQHQRLADFLHASFLNMAFLAMPLDWALMRQAPCPVLVSKGTPWKAGSPLLAAVDAADEEHQSLNREILRRAAGLADVIGAELHVATAYPDLGQTVDELQVASDFDGIKADMRRTREQRLAAMLTELGIRAREVHLLEGKPGRVIPALAAGLGPAVTVLGTVARHGVGKMLLGNTAEDLIDRLPGDLMTVRAPWS